MLQFAILSHDHPHLHWDFLVEQSPGENLKTWRLDQPPAEGICINAEALPDHRRLYLDYEGPVSGNRGEVKRWDGGPVEILSHEPAKITLKVQGDRLRGIVVLEQQKNDQWQFRYTASPTGDKTPFPDPSGNS